MNFFDFFNSEAKENPRRIFFKEEVKSMPPEEYALSEKAILYQAKTVGLPSQKDLHNSQGVVHVKAYSKAGGIHVKEHYRSAPLSGISFSSEPPYKSESNLISGGLTYNEGVEDGSNGENTSSSGDDALAWAAVGMAIIAAFQMVSQIASEMTKETVDTSENNSKHNLKTPKFNNSKEPTTINNNKYKLTNAINNLKELSNTQKIHLDKLNTNLSHNSDPMMHKILIHDYANKKQTFDQIQQQISKLENQVQNNKFDEISKETNNQTNKKIFKSFISNPPNANAGEINSLKPFNVETYRSIAKDFTFGVGKENVFNALSRTELNLANDVLANKLPITNELMRHAVENLKDITYTPNARLMTEFPTAYKDLLPNDQLIRQAELGIRQGWKAIEYSANSQVAKEISNSSEINKFIDQNDAALKAGIGLNSIGQAFNSTSDLAKSLGHASILNAQIKDGVFTCTVYDVYDFSLMDELSVNALINNTAYGLQSAHLIKNYFIIIHIEKVIE